jgi:hypothetical protein
VATRPGVAACILGPASLLVAVAASVAFAFTPLVVTGPGVHVGFAFATGGIVVAVGIALSVASIMSGARATKGARRRSAAIALGITGIVLWNGGSDAPCRVGVAARLRGLHALRRVMHRTKRHLCRGPILLVPTAPRSSASSTNFDGCEQLLQPVRVRGLQWA